MRPIMATLFIALALATGPFGSAQTRPDLNGTWKMNPSKSKLDPEGAPAGIVIRFDQKGPDLKETLTLVGSGGERTLNLSYTTDGKERVSQIGADEVKTVAQWEGDSLVLEWRGEGRSFRRKFTLSEGGKAMTVAVHHSSPEGEKDETVILEKQ